MYDGWGRQGRGEGRLELHILLMVLIFYSFVWGEGEEDCHNPTFGRVWGWYSHSRNGELGVLWDSRNFRVRFQGSKNLALRRSSCNWKALNESYKFASDLIPIRGLSKELWTHKVPGVQTETVLGLLLGSLETKSHSNVGVVE
jgi:hypothetical protein